MEVVIWRRALQACTWFEDRVSVEREDGKWDPLDLGEDYNDGGEDNGDHDDDGDRVNGVGVNPLDMEKEFLIILNAFID